MGLVKSVNKVDYNGKTLIDLTGDTVTPDTLLTGVTAHNAQGEIVTGTVELPTKLSQLDGELTTDEQTSVRTLIGAGTSNFDGDFNSLKNLPFYPSIVDISWNGDTTDKTATLSQEIEGAGQIPYYNMSDEIVKSDKVIGANVSYMFDTSEQELTVATSSILFADDSTSGSFCIMLTDPMYLPLIICVQKPETLSFTIEGVGSVKITFTESGIYFVNYFGIYTSSFSQKGKTLAEEFIPDIYQKKLECPQLSLGACDSNGYVINYISLIINNYINQLSYNITTDSFVVPIIMSQTLSPTDGITTLKIVTGTDSLGNATDYISVSTSPTTLYSEKAYFLVAVKQRNGIWGGRILGKTDSPIDTTPTSGSENLITSGAVYTAINEAIGTALGGSY